jgi:hypothetical protein
MSKLNALIKLNSSAALLGPLSANFLKEIQITYSDIECDNLTLNSDTASTIVPSDYTGTSYVYIRNTNTANSVHLQTTGAVAFATILPGDFAFFSSKPSTVLGAISSNGALKIEYLIAKVDA